MKKGFSWEIIFCACAVMRVTSKQSQLCILRKWFLSPGLDLKVIVYKLFSAPNIMNSLIRIPLLRTVQLLGMNNPSCEAEQILVLVKVTQSVDYAWICFTHTIQTCCRHVHTNSAVSRCCILFNAHLSLKSFSLKIKDMQRRRFLHALSRTTWSLYGVGLGYML